MTTGSGRRLFLSTSQNHYSMENTENKATTPKEKEAFRLLFELHDAFSDKSRIIESLHTMFIGYVQSQELDVDQKVVDSYLQMRYVLKETEKMFNHKEDSHD